jgi:hypothetical protein
MLTRGPRTVVLLSRVKYYYPAELPDEWLADEPKEGPSRAKKPGPSDRPSMLPLLRSFLQPVAGTIRQGSR